MLVKRPPQYSNKLYNHFDVFLFFTVGSTAITYKWELVSDSIPSGYICEISKEDAQARLIDIRDFSKL